MRADNSSHIIDAARQRSEYTRSKAIQALKSLEAAAEPVTFQSVAELAGVSRSWLYAQADLREQIQRLRETQRRTPDSPRIPTRQRSTDASLLRRLESANARIKQLSEDNKTLRERLARTLGEQRATTRQRTGRKRP